MPSPKRSALDEFLDDEDVGSGSLAGGAIMKLDDPAKREKVATGMFVGFLVVSLVVILGINVATYVKVNKKSD